MVYRNFTGIIVNDLTVISHAGKSKSGQTIYNCLCKCGKECVKQASGLATGTTHDCGCKRRKRLTQSKLRGWEYFAKDITNKFPHYFVLDYFDGKCSTRWKFSCSICGDTFHTTPNQLRSHDKYPCSCRHLDREKADELINEIEDICERINGEFVKWDDIIYKGRSKSTVTIKCKTHHTTKSICISDLLKAKARFSCCTTRGFKNGEKATFYVTKWKSTENYFYKYGIAKDYKRRVRNQRTKTDYIPENLLIVTFSAGTSAQILEQSVKNFCGKGVIDKKYFTDGYTETFNRDKLDEVTNIIAHHIKRQIDETTQYYQETSSS